MLRRTHDVSDILKMTVSLLEQQLSGKILKENENRLTFLSGRFLGRLNECELNEFYSLLTQYSGYQWSQLKIQTVKMAQSWLQPLNDANCEEESALPT